MPSSDDLSGLARLAQSLDPDLRPLVMRVQTAAFAALPSPSGEDVARFRSLALGLIPLLTSDTLAEALRRLVSCPGAPAEVLACLRDRLSLAGDPASGAVAEASRPDLAPGATERLIALEASTVDLALARNRSIVLGGRALDCLIGRARLDPALAAALLAREELSRFGRAALYRVDDGPGRARTRRELAASPVGQAGPASPDPTLRDALLRRAEAGDVAGLVRDLCDRLGVGQLDPLGPSDADREILALLLRAARLAPEDCIRVFLTADGSLARSVRSVAHLAEVARQTSPAVAARIIAAVARPEGPRSSAVRLGRAGATGRPALPRPVSGPTPKRVSPRPSREGDQDRDTSVRADRRSRSTTGRDRT